MRTLARLSLAAVAVAYLEIMLGSWTRINRAGMTCPDYPLCRGSVIPAFTGGTVWEWTHRLTALVLSVLVITILVSAWKRRARAPFVQPAAALVGGLFALQVFLGAATVRLSNSPVSVVWHWGTAMAFVAALTVLAIAAYGADRGEPAQPESLRTAGVLAVTGLIAFATMCIGAYVSSSGAGLACLSLPACSGNVIVYGDGQYVQMVHRIAAAACLLSAATAFAVVWISRSSRRVRVAATLGLGLVFVQILLGLLNVALRLPIDLREAHAANAALVFLCFVCGAAFAATESAFAPRLAA